MSFQFETFKLYTTVTLFNSDENREYACLEQFREDMQLILPEDIESRVVEINKEEIYGLTEIQEEYLHRIGLDENELEERDDVIYLQHLWHIRGNFAFDGTQRECISYIKRETALNLVLSNEVLLTDDGLVTKPSSLEVVGGLDCFLLQVLSLEITPESKNSFRRHMILDMARIMNCLVSTPARDDLYSRFNDEYLIEIMDGLTEVTADLGVEWWNQNPTVISDIGNLFANSLMSTANDLNLEVHGFVDIFWQSTWRDLIRETYYFLQELVAGHRQVENELDIQYFIENNVAISLEYTGLNCESINLEQGVTTLFAKWFVSDEPWNVYSSIFDLTIEGRNLLKQKGDTQFP